MPRLETATFGGRDGSHQLLESSLPKTIRVLDLVRFLVDRPAGHIDSGVTWSPYWGCGPVGDWWAFWRGEEDVGAPRKNMVRARVVLIPQADVGEVKFLDVLTLIGDSDLSPEPADIVQRGDFAIAELASGRRPVLLSGEGLVPHLLRVIWPRLWASARASLSLRTLFGVESLDEGNSPHIVVVPAELRCRWQGRQFLDGTPVAMELSPRVRQLLESNIYTLPGDLTVLGRIKRIASCLDRLHDGTGGVADALLVARTVEALPFQIVLPDDEKQVLVATLENIKDASIGDVRSASLTSLDWLDGADAVQAALAEWASQHLPEQRVPEAIWIIEKQFGTDHAEWWRRSISAGLQHGCRGLTSRWGRVLWLWWSNRPEFVLEIELHLGTSMQVESWLLRHVPQEVSEELLDRIVELCQQRDWPRLLAGALKELPLSEALAILRASTSSPETALDVLLDGYRSKVIVEVAVTSQWVPLRDSAVGLTVARPSLLACVESLPGFSSFLQLHLARGGIWPPHFTSWSFVSRLCDEVVDGQAHAIGIFGYLDEDIGAMVLAYPRQEEFWSIVLPTVSEKFIKGAVDEWWLRFLDDEGAYPPVSSLRSRVHETAALKVKGASVTLVVTLLRLLPEIEESEFKRWMRAQDFLWAVGDHARLGKLLVKRDWRDATKALRWSNHNHKLVAWHARELLAWYEKFWEPPEGSRTVPAPIKPAIKIVFLASNPLSSQKLDLGEEARSIEDKVRQTRFRDEIKFRTRWAVRPEDLQQILLEDEPTVVHFSGHGGGDAGIMLHASTECGESFLEASVLVDLFRVHKENIRVVVLNACYSDIQAQSIIQEIDFVVGMSDSVGDDAARVFAAAFYRGLGFGKSVQAAFDQGLLELKLVGCDDDAKTPKLVVKDSLDATSTFLIKNT